MAALLIQKLQNRQLQSFDGLSVEEIPALEPLKARLIEPSVLTLLSLQSDFTETLPHSESRLVVSHYRSNRTELIEESGTGPARKTALRKHMTRPTAIGWLLFGQCYCSSPTSRDVDLQSVLIIMPRREC